jgi:hypothetical protein
VLRETHKGLRDFCATFRKYDVRVGRDGHAAMSALRLGAEHRLDDILAEFDPDQIRANEERIEFRQGGELVVAHRSYAAFQPREAAYGRTHPGVRCGHLLC